MLSGIILINLNDLMEGDAPATYGPHKTLYSRWTRRSDKGILARMMAGLAAEHTDEKAHRPATSLGVKKGERGRLIGCPKGGMSSKLQAVTDAAGRSVRMFPTAEQRSDYIGARALLDALLPAEHLFAGRGCDAGLSRETLEDKGIRACIPGLKQRKKSVEYDKRRYKRRSRIETMFGRLKGWRRVATRYDRCPKVFLSAIALAVRVI